MTKIESMASLEDEKNKNVDEDDEDEDDEDFRPDGGMCTTQLCILF